MVDLVAAMPSIDNLLVNFMVLLVYKLMHLLPNLRVVLHVRDKVFSLDHLHSSSQRNALDGGGVSLVQTNISEPKNSSVAYSIEFQLNRVLLGKFRRLHLRVVSS